MATFTVDPVTLEELSSTLSGVHSEMQNMHGMATGYEGLLGGSDLEGGGRALLRSLGVRDRSVG